VTGEWKGNGLGDRAGEDRASMASLPRSMRSRTSESWAHGAVQPWGEFGITQESALVNTPAGSEYFGRQSRPIDSVETVKEPEEQNPCKLTQAMNRWQDIGKRNRNSMVQVLLGNRPTQKLNEKEKQGFASSV